MRNNFLLYNIFPIAISGMLCSCSAIKSYPDRPVQAKDQLQQLTWCFKYDSIKKPEPINEDPTIWRDKVINCQIYAIDLNFTLFEQSLSRESVGLNTGVDMAVIGLGAATAIVGNATTKSIFGAISGGITGAKGTIDKDIFYSKTMPALLSQMEAQRKAQLVIIRTGLQKKSDKYSLDEAIIDVENYYKAGSIPAALQGIVQHSGAVADAANNDLKKLVSASTADVASISNIRSEFNRLFNSWSDNPDSDNGKKSLKTAKDILKEVRIDVNNINDNDIFKKLDKEISKADPGSEQFKKLQEAFDKQKAK